MVGAGRAGAVYWRPLPGEDRGARVIALIEATLERGRGAIVVTPEVAAGSAVGDAVRKAFPDAADLASDLSDRRRYRAWAELRQGRRLVVVGGRSSVLAPLPALGCVIVDDEANFAHKEQRAPRFHTREVALRRAATARALCVLTGTVPSAEALAAMQAGQCRLVAPDRAVERAARPLVEVVDPDDEGPTAARLHPRGLAAIRGALARDEPAYVLVPRRGGADPASPGARSAGQVAAELGRILPGVPVWRLDREVVDPGMVPPWAGQQPGVVVGTVAGVKDHPPLTGCRTVVVVGADTALGQAEVRSAEEAYRTWSRAAAWCGPRSGVGRLVLQTRHGGHHAVQALVRWDPEFFWRHELPAPGRAGLPPGPAPGPHRGTGAGRGLGGHGRPRRRPRAQGRAARPGGDGQRLAYHRQGRGRRVGGQSAAPPARRGIPGRRPAHVGGRRAPRSPGRPPLASVSRRRTGPVAVLEIRLFGDPVLTQRSDPVTRFDAELARFGDDLLETLQFAHGAGLAAPQVGVLKRMFAYDIPPDEETGEHPFGVLVNPVITRWEGEQDGEEGCLSFPGIYYACKRAMEVTVAAVDVRGQPLELDGEGLLARCIQHEIDHLDGVLFIERLSRGDRKRALKQWREREFDLELEGFEPHLHRSDLTIKPDKTF